MTSPTFANWIPPQVQLLASREREVATIVYSRGPSTARDIQERLSSVITNTAVRSMLVRLVAKGILDRCAGGRGKGQQYIYLPKITPTQLKKQALRQIAEQYFDGSLVSVAVGALELIEDVAGDDLFRSQQPATGKRGTSEAPLPFNRAA